MPLSQLSITMRMLELILLALNALSEDPDWKAKLPPEAISPVEIIDPAKIPVEQAGTIAPKLLEEESVAVWAQDIGSGKALYSQKAYREQPIASLTKIMTALVILNEHELDEVVTVSPDATRIIGAQIDLYDYEKLTIETLLEAILIPSANDAAIALSIYNADTEDAFVEKMNTYAQKYNLKKTKFYNSTGLDLYDEESDTYYGNMSTAFEVAELTRIAMQNPFFRKTVRKTEFYGTSTDGQFAHTKPTTNQLMGSFTGSIGVKTGYTFLAGQCLVNLSRRADGVEILTVVLGSPDRFQETKNILTWLWDNFEWR